MARMISFVSFSLRSPSSSTSTLCVSPGPVIPIASSFGCSPSLSGPAHLECRDIEAHPVTKSSQVEEKRLKRMPVERTDDLEAPPTRACCGRRIVPRTRRRGYGSCGDGSCGAGVVDPIEELTGVKYQRLRVDISHEIVVSGSVVLLSQRHRLPEREPRIGARQAVATGSVEQDRLGDEPPRIDLGDPRLALLVAFQVDAEGARCARVEGADRPRTGFYDPRLVDGLGQRGHGGSSARLALGEKIGQSLTRLCQDKRAV